jgi:hypothetical protein
MVPQRSGGPSEHCERLSVATARWVYADYLAPLHAIGVVHIPVRLLMIDTEAVNSFYPLLAAPFPLRYAFRDSGIAATVAKKSQYCSLTVSG